MQRNRELVEMIKCAGHLLPGSQMDCHLLGCRRLHRLPKEYVNQTWRGIQHAALQFHGFVLARHMGLIASRRVTRVALSFTIEERGALRGSPVIRSPILYANRFETSAASECRNVEMSAIWSAENEEKAGMPRSGRPFRITGPIMSPLLSCNTSADRTRSGPLLP